MEKNYINSQACKTILYIKSNISILEKQVFIQYMILRQLEHSDSGVLGFTN